MPKEEEPKKHRVQIIDPKIEDAHSSPPRVNNSLPITVSPEKTAVISPNDFSQIPLTPGFNLENKSLFHFFIYFSIEQQEYKDKVLKFTDNLDAIAFLDCLELEHFRLEKGITPQQRDSILLGLKLEIETFNPDRFIYLRDEKSEDILFLFNPFFFFSLTLLFTFSKKI